MVSRSQEHKRTIRNEALRKMPFGRRLNMQELNCLTKLDLIQYITYQEIYWNEAKKSLSEATHWMYNLYNELLNSPNKELLSAEIYKIKNIALAMNKEL